MKLIVTGAAGALGIAAASLLERKGHDVARIVLRAAPDAPALTIGCEDLAQPEAAARAIELSADRLGGLDGVLHLAGAFDWRPVAESDVTLWQAMFRANLETTLSVVKAALPLLAPDGAIVTIGAASAVPSGAGMAPYAASKSAVARLTESLAAELRPGGIRINTLLPGIIDTPANRAAMPGADFSTWTHPDAVADAAAFLLSPSARAIHGALIPVTNGVGR
jgi:NAD(P)-dependent dehydrogenase (short-subunit alcohol dehydrogenase family)